MGAATDNAPITSSGGPNRDLQLVRSQRSRRAVSFDTPLWYLFMIRSCNGYLLWCFPGMKPRGKSACMRIMDGPESGIFGLHKVQYTRQIAHCSRSKEGSSIDITFAADSISAPKMERKVALVPNIFKLPYSGPLCLTRASPTANLSSLSPCLRRPSDSHAWVMLRVPHKGVARQVNADNLTSGMMLGVRSRLFSVMVRCAFFVHVVLTSVSEDTMIFSVRFSRLRSFTCSSLFHGQRARSRWYDLRDV
ncbi:hypothetical protein BDW75DRAFT_50698 [Aspergillus navahoensis]